jgi:hypothetical protein
MHGLQLGEPQTPLKKPGYNQPDKTGHVRPYSRLNPYHYPGRQEEYMVKWLEAESLVHRREVKFTSMMQSSPSLNCESCTDTKSMDSLV